LDNTDSSQSIKSSKAPAFPCFGQFLVCISTHL